MCGLPIRSSAASKITCSIISDQTGAEGAFHARHSQSHRGFILAIQFSNMDTNWCTDRTIGCASPETTNTHPDIHTNSSHGVPRRCAMAPVLRDLSHKSEPRYLDGTA